MQEKLKQVYMRNKMKKQHEIYRNPVDTTINSSDFSSEKPRSSLRTSSTSQAKGDFFDQSPQHFSSR